MPQSTRVLCYNSVGQVDFNSQQLNSAESKNDLFNRKVCELGADCDEIAKEIAKVGGVGSRMSSQTKITRPQTGATCSR